jgi:hypothetical protein
MKTPTDPKKRAARAYVIAAGTRRGGGRGRSDRSVGATWSTPVKFVPGAEVPRLEGLPYWKTTIWKGSFSRTLYTPSTLRIVCGADWTA